MIDPFSKNKYIRDQYVEFNVCLRMYFLKNKGILYRCTNDTTHDDDYSTVVLL